MIYLQQRVRNLNKFIEVRSIDVMVVKRRHLETRGGRGRQLEAVQEANAIKKSLDRRSENFVEFEENFATFWEKVSQYEVNRRHLETKEAIESDLEATRSAIEDENRSTRSQDDVASREAVEAVRNTRI